MPKVTIEDVARDAGVSAMTVSRVMNDQPGVGEHTRERVQEAVRRLEYRPNSLARGLKARISNTIGLVVPDITNPFFPEIVRGAEDVALEAGYGVFLSNAVEDREREASSLARMEERRVDGIIVVSPRLDEARLHALLRGHPAAVVVNREAPSEVAGSVRLDHADGIRQAIDHLGELGRTRIAVLAGPASSSAATERLHAIETLLAERGLALPPEHVLKTAPYIDEGAAAARRLLSAGPMAPGEGGTRGGPTGPAGADALLCYNDLVAAGALQACAALGIGVPADLAVIGFDDIAFARMFTPPLTTLHVPKYELGAAAMRMLLDRIHGRRSPAEVMFRPTLVVRDSTSASARHRVPQEVPA